MNLNRVHLKDISWGARRTPASKPRHKRSEQTDMLDHQQDCDSGGDRHRRVG